MSNVTDRVANLSAAKKALLERVANKAAPGHDLQPELYEGTVVPLQPKGSRKPLFLIHATDGSVSYFQYLTKHLGPDQPVFALQTPGLNVRRTPYTSIPEQAAHYLEENQKIDSTGPPLVAGYCMGGLPAFEIGQHLLRRGAPIDSVIHISPIMDRDWEHIEAEQDPELRAAHDFLFLADKIMGIQLPMDWQALRASSDRMAFLIEQAVEHQCLPPDLDMESFQRRIDAYRANLHAMKTYRPSNVRPCTVKVLLVSRRGEEAKLDFDSVYTAYLASVPSDQIQIIPVDADPIGIINGEEPGLGVTASAIQQLLPA
jgi:thioesterase domain-containing protein